jgi:hypothetical protein
LFNYINPELRRISGVAVTPNEFSRYLSGWGYLGDGGAGVTRKLAQARDLIERNRATWRSNYRPVLAWRDAGSPPPKDPQTGEVHEFYNSTWARSLPVRRDEAEDYREGDDWEDDDWDAETPQQRRGRERRDDEERIPGVDF